MEAPPVNTDDNVCTGKKRIVLLVSRHVFVFRIRHGRYKGRLIGYIDAEVKYWSPDGTRDSKLPASPEALDMSTRRLQMRDQHDTASSKMFVDVAYRCLAVYEVFTDVRGSESSGDAPAHTWPSAMLT